MLKKAIRKIFPKKTLLWFEKFKTEHITNYYFRSYSQEGEDMILRRIFENKMTGFYVDVGAHHPKRFSNTFFFYRRGWRGINIDAMPGSMEAFKRSRSRDINIEQPISDKNEFLTYYAFNEPALNGFSKSISNERDGQGGYKIIFTKDLQTNTLDEVLAKNLPDDVEKIDFLSIDVEGFDFRVLKSINLDVHKPEVILVEMLKSGLTDLNDSEITKYLGGFGYSIYSKAVNTVFFRRTCHS